MQESGGSLALAVMSGRVQWPAAPAYPAALQDLVMFMLETEIQRRPHLHQVIERTEQLVAFGIGQ